MSATTQDADRSLTSGETPAPANFVVRLFYRIALVQQHAELMAVEKAAREQDVRRKKLENDVLELELEIRRKQLLGPDDRDHQKKLPPSTGDATSDTTIDTRSRRYGPNRGRPVDGKRIV